MKYQHTTRLASAAGSAVLAGAAAVAAAETEVDSAAVDKAFETPKEVLATVNPDISDVDVADADEVVRNWEAIKSTEKPRDSLVEGIPRHLPSLQKAHRVQSRAARVGFDWDDIRDVVAKVEEAGSCIGEVVERSAQLGEVDHVDRAPELARMERR